MFTGIVEATGTVEALPDIERGGRLSVRVPEPLQCIEVGDSLAINGVCLTVVERGGGRLHFDVVPETLKRSNLGDLKCGATLNLERPLAGDGRINGHFVQGHVDATVELLDVEEVGNSQLLRMAAPRPIRRYMALKGSIAIDGISLTIAELGEDDFKVAIIPHTWEVTNLCTKRRGDRLNVEVDIIAKYIESLITYGDPTLYNSLIENREP